MDGTVGVSGEGEQERWHRELASRLFNRTWELLDMERGVDDDRELLLTAYASRYHWSRVGTDRNLAIGDWQLSRVWSTLGNPGLAADYAELSRRRAASTGLGPFLEGYGHEALARAALIAGDRDTADHHVSAARALLPAIDDAEEREVLEGDLEDLERRLDELH